VTKFRALLLLPALALVGCAAVGPNYHVPHVDVPARWSEAPSASAPAPETPSCWWLEFEDPELNSLIDRAVAANLDLQNAEARVREARANRLVAKAPLYPSVSTTGSFTRSQLSQNAAGTTQAAGERSIPPTNLYQAGFDVSWEIDVFGGIRRSVEAATDTLQATAYDREDVLLTLLAEVARNYIELRGFQRQLEVTRQNLDSQTDTLNLTRARYQGGLATDLDVARAEAQAETTASDLPTLEISYGQAVHRIGVLLGEDPGALADELSPNRPIPGAPSALPPGLPSDLLRQRPDIRRSERQLAAATAQIGVATADLYPKFSLSGSAGLSSISASDFFTGASKAWSFGPTITWPIFQGGQIKANIEVRDAQAQQALLTYRQTILSAFEDTENAILEFNQERERSDRLDEAVRSNQRAAEYSTQLYLRGLTDFLSVLDAQRNLFVAQVSLVQSQVSLSTDLVALHKALGGGWDAFPMRAETATRPPVETVTARQQERQ